MPELPEVETVRRGLVDSIKGKTIKTVTLRRDGLRYPFPENLVEILENSKINEIRRRSKYLLVDLNNGQSLIIHLGMSGRITVHKNLPNELAKHDHMIVTFSDITTMIFNDARRFGMVLLCPTKDLPSHKLLKDIGPEPLDEGFDGNELFARLNDKNVDMKAALMDQRIVAGLGNIYVCESLFDTGISPKRIAKKVSQKESASLVPNIKSVLNSAIESGGSTLRDYVQSTGGIGYFQHQFKVYGRENKDCVKCGEKIKRIVQSGRSTFFCSTCQK